MATSTQFAQLFRAVVVTGNYTRAARQLGVTPAAVSKAVAKQELALGVPLLRRTTRSMAPTEAGQRYYEQCCRALALLEEAEQLIARDRAQPSGLVRVSVPTTYGHFRVLPWIPRFLESHPLVRLDLDISNGNVDFVTERCDLAVRMGEIADSSLVARKLEDAPFGVFASPGYLEAHGQPGNPAELRHHRCLMFIRPSTGRPLPWAFVDRRGKPFELMPEATVRCAGDVLGCATLARAGVGLVQAYRFIVEDDVRHGRLVEILQPFSGRTSRFSLLRARRAHSPAVQRFADALVEHCAPDRPAIGRRGDTRRV
jgi:DNA-binding transcriptional LysR family regulator